MKYLIVITASLILPHLALAEDAKDCSVFEKHVKYYSEKLNNDPKPDDQKRLEKELEAANERLKECNGGKKLFGLFG